LTHLVVSLVESLRGSTDHVAAIRTGPGILLRYVRELTYCTTLKVITCGLVAFPTHQWKLQTPTSSETLVYCYQTIRHHIQNNSELYHNSRQQIMVQEQTERKNHGCESKCSHPLPTRPSDRRDTKVKKSASWTVIICDEDGGDEA